MCGMSICLFIRYFDVTSWVSLFERNRGFFWVAGVHCTLTTLATGINLSRKKKLKNGRQRTDWPMDWTFRSDATPKSHPSISRYASCPLFPTWPRLHKHDQGLLACNAWFHVMRQHRAKYTVSCSTKWRFHVLDFIKHCSSVKPQCLYPELNILYRCHHLHITTSVKWITTNTIPIKK